MLKRKTAKEAGVKRTSQRSGSAFENARQRVTDMPDGQSALVSRSGEDITWEVQATALEREFLGW
jgi:hypothetical protein